MKKTLLALMVGLTIASVADAKIAEDRIAIGGIHPDHTISDVTAVYGKPVKAQTYGNVTYYDYASNGTTFQVMFDNGIVKNIRVVGNNGLATPDGLKIGSLKEDVVKAYGQADLYYLSKDAPKQHPDSEFFRYFSANGKNIYLNFEVRYGKVLNIDVATYVNH